LIKAQKGQGFNVKDYHRMDIDEVLPLREKRSKSFQFKVVKGLRQDIHPFIQKVEASTNLQGIYSKIKHLRSQNSTMQSNMKNEYYERMKRQLN
jgi:hypothetical protein